MQISLRPISKTDFDFVYKVTKMTMQTHVEQTWGCWDDDEQRTVIYYDLEVKTYNDLILRRSIKTATPCILILLAIPADSTQWLLCEESELRLRGTCYWEYLSGSPSRNRSSVRIRIPRSQRLTPESLLTLIENVKTGEW